MAVGVLGVSTSGPLIAATVAPALAIAFWRNGMASGVLVPYALATHRQELLRLPRRTAMLAVGAGALLALHFAVWIPSLRYTSVASSTALVCMQAVWATVFSRLTGDAVSGRAWVGLAVAVTGVLVLTGVDVSLSGDALLGNGLALLGGVFSGAYVVVGGRVRRTMSTTAYTSVCYAVCALLLLVVCLVSGSALWGYAGWDWARLVVLTLAAQLLGHSLFNTVLSRVSPTVVSLAILLEVPGAALLAGLFLDQVPPLAAVPALAMILLGIALVIRASGSAVARAEVAEVATEAP